MRTVRAVEAPAFGTVGDRSCSLFVKKRIYAPDHLDVANYAIRTDIEGSYNLSLDVGIFGGLRVI